MSPKSSWSSVKALLHSVYDQPDADALHALFNRIRHALLEKPPTVADHLDRPQTRSPDPPSLPRRPEPVKPNGVKYQV